MLNCSLCLWTHRWLFFWNAIRRRLGYAGKNSAFKSDEHIKLYRRAINIIQNYLPQEQRQQLKRISKRKLICFGMKLLLKAPVNIAEWGWCQTQDKVSWHDKFCYVLINAQNKKPSNSIIWRHLILFDKRFSGEGGIRTLALFL